MNVAFTPPPTTAVDIDALLRLSMPVQIEIVRSIGLSIAGDQYATPADRLNGQAIADSADEIERDHYAALRGDDRDTRRVMVCGDPAVAGAGYGL